MCMCTIPYCLFHCLHSAPILGQLVHDVSVKYPPSSAFPTALGWPILGGILVLHCILQCLH